MSPLLRMFEETPQGHDKSSACGGRAPPWSRQEPGRVQSWGSAMLPLLYQEG